MNVVELWSLREDTLLELRDGEAVVGTRWGDIRLPGAPSALTAALRRMTLGPVSLRNAGHDGTGLDELEHVIVRSLATGDGIPLLSAVPISTQARLRPRRADPRTPHRLSRFAQLRVVGDRPRLESPLSAYRIELHRTDASLLASCFGGPSAPADAAARLGLPLDLVSAAAGYLLAAGMLVESGDDGGFAEDRDAALLTWSPHDLMLHSRSRLGRHDDPFGATFAHAAQVVPEPPVKPVGKPAGAATVALPRPDLDRLLSADPPITAVMEARRSVRRFGTRPLSLAEVGELLYRSARVRSLIPARPGDPDDVPRSSRPYPSTGGAYALELYLVAGGCAGLARGVYGYEPMSHALSACGAPERAVDQLLEDARICAGLPGEPPALIVITGRFQRLTRRYEGMAYSGLLKDVGVLLQTFSLVCTAMGLGSCALAAGDSDLSAQALGLDWLCESSIGELVVGAPAPGGPVFAEPALPVNDADWPWRCADALRRGREGKGWGKGLAENGR